MDGKSLDFDLAAMVTVLVAVRVRQRQRRRMKRRRRSVWVRRIFGDGVCRASITTLCRRCNWQTLQTTYLTSRSADTVHAQILEVSSSCAIFNEHAVNVDKRILIANLLNVACKNRKQFYSLRLSATGCYATLQTRCFGHRVAPQALRPIVNQA